LISTVHFLLSYYCCTESTLWHLKECLQYILVKFTSSIILLHFKSFRWAKIRSDRSQGKDYYTLLFELSLDTAHQKAVVHTGLGLVALFLQNSISSSGDMSPSTAESPKWHDCIHLPRPVVKWYLYSVYQGRVTEMVTIVSLIDGVWGYCVLTVKLERPACPHSVLTQLLDNSLSQSLAVLESRGVSQLERHSGSFTASNHFGNPEKLPEPGCPKKAETQLLMWNFNTWIFFFLELLSNPPTPSDCVRLFSCFFFFLQMKVLHKQVSQTPVNSLPRGVFPPLHVSTLEGTGSRGLLGFHSVFLEAVGLFKLWKCFWITKMRIQFGNQF
jgi:hypothetical protein